MSEFEILVLLLATAIGLGMLADWVRLPYPVMLVLGGLLISLLPGVPHYTLPPDIVFLVFLPPILYSAAFNTHWPRFRKQLQAISLLAFGLVLFTTLGVAWAANVFLGMGWGPAFVLGAVVSPPDAVAAVAVTRRIRVPNVVTTLLEGESLVNDASALVAYRMAVAAVVTGVFSASDAGVQFVLVAAGGIAFGLFGGGAVMVLHHALNRARIADSKTTIAITLLTPYLIYLPAEHAHFSGVLAVVVAGLIVGANHRRIFPAALMGEARAVWETMEFVLNGLIFILIGFHLPAVHAGLSADMSVLELVKAAALISAVVIVTRLLWVYPGAYVPRFLGNVVTGERDSYPPWQVVTVVAWTGMRGVVSLASALAIPQTIAGGKPFPHRDLILFLTFWVIFATLVLQGLTLPFLIQVLGVSKRAERANLPASAEVVS
jgi:Na+/H+ antiporter